MENGIEKEKKNLNAAMLYYLFNAANMHRWNDHFRTVDLTELDKQAHKAIIAWVLGKCEEDAGNSVDWNIIIEHTLFSFIQRIAITDIKPPVYHKIMESHKTEINDYVFKEFSRLVPDMTESFMERFKDYLNSDNKSKEDDIISAAHYLATRYEFDLIKGVNSTSYGINDTAEAIENQVNGFMDLGLAGMDALKNRESKLYGFINLLGQLRCQQRWARTPREPKTTVLGHCILVADSVYLNDLDKGVSGRQLYNDFYSGLFHDLPEVLTKDVITPVKNSSTELPNILSEIETEMFVDKVHDLIPESWHEELGCMALKPFEHQENFERDCDAIKACDNLAAWMEAYISVQYGMNSKILRDAMVTISDKLLNDGKGVRIGAADLLVNFENMEI
ncbi:MAG: HD domain-containing protein [archaeon]|nr:HD domain-containing protein [archaeon]